MFEKNLQLCLNSVQGSIQKEFCISIPIIRLVVKLTTIIIMDPIIRIIHEGRTTTMKFKSIARQIAPNRPLNFIGTSTVSR
jgi:hypothetical protein